MTAPAELRLPVSAPPRERLRHAEHVMGTVVSIDIPAAAARVLPEVLRWLHWVDATFSPYRDDSDVSRFGRGELSLAQCAPEFAEVLIECAIIRDQSDGYFTTMPGGRFDPSGLVKGWAIERAAAILNAAGFAGHCVNGGGDIQCSGEPQAGRPWRVGVTDPLRPGELAAVVSGRDFAVATSGTAERGAHIFNPHTGRAATGLAGITVVGPRLTTADAYATAAMAMGDAAREWAEHLDGYEAFATTTDGDTWQTSRFRARLSLRPLLDLFRCRVGGGMLEVTSRNRSQRRKTRRGTILKHTVRAADGRRLSTQTYGDPDGRPVFLLHGTPGSRLGPHPRSAVLHRLGVRLISFDRPGYGESDRVAGRRVADVAADVLTIADAYYGSRTWCRELGRGVRRG